jgi:tetratricopeptide (TPR) repeat protein
MIRSAAIVAASGLIAAAASFEAPAQQGRSAASRCGLPSRAESLFAARPRAARTPPLSAPALRARADTLARYAAYRPEARPDSAALARALQAQIELALGRPDSALAPARLAVLLASNARGRSSEAAARAALGEVLQSRGHADSALAQYDSALDAIARPEQVRDRGRLCSDIGIAYQDLGVLDRAREYLMPALALRVAIADSDGIAVTLNNVGRLQQTLGRPDASLTWLARAVATHRALGDSVGVAAAMANIGYAYDLMADPARALAAYDTARRALSTTSHDSYAGLTLLNIGRAHLALGHLETARDDVQAGLDLKRKAGDAAGVSWGYHDLGRVEVARGHLDEGLAWLDSARRAMRAAGDRSREGSALYYAGLAHQHASASQTAHLQAAVADYGAAMTARLAVGRRAGNDADRIMFAEQDVSLTAKWVLAWLALGRGVAGDSSDAASLVAAEQGRARALLDLLQQSARNTAIADSMAISHPSAAVAELLAPLRRTATPSLSYLVTPTALVTWLTLGDGRVRSACQRLAPHALDSLVARMRAHIWADRAGETHVIARVSTMLGDTSDDAPVWCAPTTIATADVSDLSLDGVLGALSKMLIPTSLLAQLPDSGELVIVPHALLGLVPFAALPVGSGGETLGIRYALRYSPSLAMLAAVRNAVGDADQVEGGRLAEGSALIVGDPTMPVDPDGSGFRPLPLARATAKWLADTLGAGNALIGDAATKSAVQTRIATATLVHLGTHGRAYATEARARDSFVVLAGADSTALLRVSDVLAMPPLSADLVVLMACETGLGDLKESEGTSGLQRAFLARGARSVLVSLWSVDQGATDELMRAFYRYWLSPPTAGGPSGQRRSKADALRLAQREVRERRSGTGNQANPYYWAGFQLVGAP